MKQTLAGAVLALALASIATTAVAAECEDNFTVSGSLGSGRTYATEAHVADVAYLPALYRVRDNIQEQGLTVLTVQEKNGYIRATNPVRGGAGGTAEAPLRVFVTPQAGSGVRVSIKFTIAGGQTTRKKTMLQNMCRIVAAAAGT